MFKHGDQVEEGCRDDGAEDPTELLQARCVVRDGAVDRLLGDDDPGADCDHDGRVPEREEVTHAERSSSPSFISLRVVLSIAEMWSASNACRSPSV